MQAEFNTRLNWGTKAEEFVFNWLINNQQEFIDTRDWLQPSGKHVKYDFIWDGYKYDIKRQFDKVSECIKVGIIDKYGKPAEIYQEDNEADYYLFVERNEFDKFIIVPKWVILKALDKGLGREEICKYDNTHWKYINIDFLQTYKVINTREVI